MKKRPISILLAMLLAVVCVFDLFGCASNETQPSTDRWANGEYTLESAYERAVQLGYTDTYSKFYVALNETDGVGINSVELNAMRELIVLDTRGKVLLRKKLAPCSHSYGNVVVESEAGCLYAGYQTKTCTKCGEKKYEAIAPIGHDWDDGITVIAPECVNGGLACHTCRICGETEVRVLPATGTHKFRNGECVYCHISYDEFLDETYNGDYGYEYFQSLPNGAKFCNLYDTIHKRVMSFHNDSKANAQENDGEYELCAINYVSYGLSTDEAASVWKTYLDDKPLYYWLSKTLQIQGENIVIFVEKEYAQGAERSAYNEKLYDLINEYREIAKDEVAYSVALAYHDAIIGSIDYAYKSGNVPQDASWAHNITGVFEGKGAVCEGYARAFQLLLNMRGIENVVVDGKSRNQAHSWNLVRLEDGKWYWYDLTWDDTSMYWGTVYKYACATDENFTATHTAASPSGVGIEFLYELPTRASEAYSGDAIKHLDEFVYEGATYVVEGYDTVSLSLMTEGGEFVIPETVSYRGRDFTVVSLMHYENGKSEAWGVIERDKKFVSVTIPSTVLYIDDGAFRNNGNDLERIIVADDNPRFCSQNGVLFSEMLHTLIAYPSGKRNMSYSIPDETHYIAHYAFDTYLDEDDRLYLENLCVGKNISLAGVANWGYGYPPTHSVANLIGGEWHIITAFLTGARNLTVDEANERYIIKDNMLLNRAQTTLYAGLPNIVTAVIPASVRYLEFRAFEKCEKLRRVTFETDSQIVEISSSAFCECVNLEEVVLPDGLRTIESFTFCMCSSLESIVIPASVTSIEVNSFYYCDNLDTVYYGATEADWDNIAIGERNDSLIEATRVYNYNPEPSELFAA